MRTAITNIPCVLMALTGALLAWLGVDHWGWFLVLAFILGVVPGESE